MSRDILVVCDNTQNHNTHILQLVTKARKLAKEVDGSVGVICFGSYDEEWINQLQVYGAENILFYETEEEVTCEEIRDFAEEGLKRLMPEVVLFPSSPTGKIVAAMLSTRFEAGLTADCIDIDLDASNELGFSRAAINDSVIARIKCINCEMKMGTIKKDVFPAEPLEEKGNGKVERYQWKGPKKRLNRDVLWQEPFEAVETIDINQYSTVFCIGRGVRSQAVKDRIVKIAEQLGAGIIGTRAAVEDGLIEKERQVGQSGKSISPNIYVAFGVSGASQHMVGIKNAKRIIAVNHDEHAPIFQYADYCIVEEVEAFIETIENLLVEQ